MANTFGHFCFEVDPSISCRKVPKQEIHPQFFVTEEGIKSETRHLEKSANISRDFALDLCLLQVRFNSGKN